MSASMAVRQLLRVSIIDDLDQNDTLPHILEAEILLDLGYEKLAAKTIAKVAPQNRWLQIRCARIMAHRDIGAPKSLLTQFPEGQEDLSFYTIFPNIERNILQLLLQ